MISLKEFLRNPEVFARAVRAARTTTRGAFDGSHLWAELHRRALAYAGDEVAERVWMKTFAERVPCGDCRRSYVRWSALHPVDLSSSDAYFRWSHALHEHANERAGHPSMSLESARERWKQ